MQSSRADEHANITSQVTPGHALSGGHLPFYFNKDAVNFAALDYLINFTGKVIAMSSLKSTSSLTVIPLIPLLSILGWRWSHSKVC